MATKYGIKKEENFKISEESATAQIVDILSYYDIDPDTLGGIDDKAGLALEAALDTLAKVVREGRLEATRDANGKLSIKWILSDGKTTMEIAEVTAHKKMVLDGFKEGQNYGRLYAFMGALCGVGTDGIKRLSPADLSTAECLGTLLSNA